MLGDPPARWALLVEGDDDEHVVRHLCNKHQQNISDLKIINKGGFDNLVKAIGPEYKASGRKVLGILVDANDDFSARWESIKDHLRNTGVNPPEKMQPEGTIIEGQPRIGIWIMPDNGSDGELEDFIQQLIPTDDPVWPLAKCYIDGIPDCARKFKQGKILRAMIHAWLATCKEPRKMGAAITANDLNASAPPAQQFIDWVQRLFR